MQSLLASLPVLLLICLSGNIIHPVSCLKLGYSLYSSQLSYLSLTLSSAAYAPNAHDCFGNSGQAGRFGELTRVTQKTMPALVGPGTWSGFVGRLAASRMTVIAFRGTVGDTQLIDEIIKVLLMPPVPFLGGKVQAYFELSQRTVWKELEPAYRELRLAEPGDSLLVTGHSLGAAMATIGAAALVLQGLAPPTDRLELYTFGEPRVGDLDFAQAFDKLLPNSWRVVHGRDPVVHLPLCRGRIERCDSSDRGGPYHHGTEVFYPDDQMQPGSTSYRICLGEPKNEDRSCSDSPVVSIKCLIRGPKSCIDAHLNYFDIHVSKWWPMNQCRP